MPLLPRLGVLAVFASLSGCSGSADTDTGGGPRPTGATAAPAQPGPGLGKPPGPNPNQKILPRGAESELPPDAPKAAPAAGVGQWVTIDDVALRIDSVSLGKVKSKDFDTEYETKDVLLVVAYSVANRSKTKKLEYSRPSGTFSRALNLADEHGNTYHARDFDSGREVEGHKGYHTIYPGDRDIRDVIGFQRPVDAATELRLTIDPHWVQSAKFEFRIPAIAWKK